MSLKVLVVDDEIHIRSLLEQTLEDLEDDFGVEVSSAGDGAEGLEMIRENRPQLVFLDVMMPKMNGFEVCQAVRDDPELNGTRIVLLTAKGQETDRKKGLDVGAVKYLTKPFDPDELLELAKKLLNIEE